MEALQQPVKKESWVWKEKSTWSKTEMLSYSALTYKTGKVLLKILPADLQKKGKNAYHFPRGCFGEWYALL